MSAEITVNGSKARLENAVWKSDDKELLSKLEALQQSAVLGDAHNAQDAADRLGGKVLWAEIPPLVFDEDGYQMIQ